jgi:hypothetical protein
VTLRIQVQDCIIVARLQGYNADLVGQWSTSNRNIKCLLCLGSIAHHMEVTVGTALLVTGLQGH